MSSVWEQLVGQQALVQQLSQAARQAVSRRHGDNRGPAAWLFTGPAGSGRSVAALAFAAALECEQAAAKTTAATPETTTETTAAPGCGQCAGCLAVLRRNSPDVRVVATQTLSHSVADMRLLVAQAGHAPSVGRWQILLVEDADRLTEPAANALLKALEEPPECTWWLLCAPTAEDVPPTIRSRCQVAWLRTPTPEQVAQVLIQRDQVEPVIAHLVAQSTQGHVGQARWLARDEKARQRQAQAWTIPQQIDTVGQCVRMAAQLLEQTQQEAQQLGQQQSEQNRQELAQALGVSQQPDRSVRVSREATAALKQQERLDKSRVKRLQRDALDRVLTELSRCYRDVLAYQWGSESGVMRPVSQQLDEQLAAAVAAAQSGQRQVVQQIAAASSAAQTVQRLDAIMAAREALEANVAPQVALEVLLLALSPGNWLAPGNGRQLERPA